MKLKMFSSNLVNLNMGSKIEVYISSKKNYTLHISLVTKLIFYCLLVFGVIA